MPSFFRQSDFPAHLPQTWRMVKRRPHEQVFALTSFPWQVLYARVDGKNGKFSLTSLLWKAGMQPFQQGDLSRKKLGYVYVSHEQIKLVMVRTYSCGRHLNRLFLNYLTSSNFGQRLFQYWGLGFSNSSNITRTSSPSLFSKENGQKIVRLCIEQRSPRSLSSLV